LGLTGKPGSDRVDQTVPGDKPVRQPTRYVYKLAMHQLSILIEHLAQDQGGVAFLCKIVFGQGYWHNIDLAHELNNLLYPAVLRSH
jgi:hypothetical protein